MPFDNDLINDVINNADIVKVISSYLDVIKKGNSYLTKCPFHDDHDPSMRITPSKKIFKCFVCGTGGSVINFVQKYEHIPFMEAVKKVADISGYHNPRLETYVVKKPVDEKRESLIKCLRDLTNYYQYALNTEEGQEGLNYLENRKLDSEIRSKYLLGYAFKDGKATIEYLQKKGNSLKTIEDTGIAVLVNGTYSDHNQGRAIFPICDGDGHVIGYSARRIKDSDEAKYVNSPETYLFHKSQVLYNLHIAKEAAHLKNYIYICEGFMDVYALHKIGIDSAVALMGTALTNEHISILRKLNVEVRICLDGDRPGQQATLKICNLLQEARINFRIVNNQGSSKDPDEILNQDGPDALKNYINDLIGHYDFVLNYYKNSNPLNTVEEKEQLVKEFIPVLVNIKGQLELDSYVRKLANVTNFEPESIMSLVVEAKKLNYQQQNSNEQASKEVIISKFHPEKKELRRLLLAEREFLFQMLHSKSAIDMYEDKLITGFYNDVYRSLANYLIDYAKNRENFNINELLVSLEASDLEDKQELIDELTAFEMENTHPLQCTKELLDSLVDTIEQEKQKIRTRDRLKDSTKDKDPQEKARIMRDLLNEKYKNKK